MFKQSYAFGKKKKPHGALQQSYLFKKKIKKMENSDKFEWREVELYKHIESCKRGVGQRSKSPELFLSL